MIKSCLLLAVILMMVGCKGGGGGDSVTSGSTSGEVKGVYSECENIDDIGYSVRTLVTVSDYGMTEAYIYHDNTNCTTSSAVEKISIHYNTQPSGGSYIFTLVAATSTMLDATYAADMDTNGYCGLSGWVKDEAQDILDQDCDGITFNGGASFSAKVYRSGSSLILSAGGEKFVYPTLNGLNFANTSPTLAQGNYFYYNGAVGVFININAGTYTATYYQGTSKKYFSEDGSYSVAGNEITLTPSAYSGGCGDPSDLGVPTTHRLATTSFSMAIEESPQVVYEKTVVSKSNFESAHLRGLYSAGCF